MYDFKKSREPTGTLYAAQTDGARHYVVMLFKQMADPMLDDVGAAAFDDMLAKGGFTVMDLDNPPKGASFRAKTDDPSLQPFVDFFNRDADREHRQGLTKSRERADCAVRAVAAVTGADYDAVHKKFKRAGRKSGQRSACGMAELIADRLGFNCETWTVDGKSITTVERELPAKGAFLISVRGHILAHVNGVTYDWAAGRRHHIEYVKRVVPKRRRAARTKR